MQFKAFEIQKILKEALIEDGAVWDWTARGAVNSRSKVTAAIVAKSSGVWAGDSVVQAVRDLSQIDLKCSLSQGDLFKKGQTLCRLKGFSHEVLAFERPMLNLAMLASGVATQTRVLVDQVALAAKKKKIKNIPRVTATRKTLPGYKDLLIESVLAGGGFSHRLNLAGGVLIKENHIRAAKGIQNAVSGVRALAPHVFKIEVEVTSFKEIDEALRAGADTLLLDNFLPKDVQKAVHELEGVPVLIEVSGGINASNISDYVIDGVHIISSGSITHTIVPVDLSLLVDF